MYVVNLLNCGEDPEEVEAGELLEVLGGPGVGGEEGGEKSRVGWHVLQSLWNPENSITESI